MRILAGAAVALAAAIGPAGAETFGAAIQAFGLVGTWATDCAHAPADRRPGFRMIVAVPKKGPPTRTTVSSDGAHTTTVEADILGALRLGSTGLAIETQVTGGDRDGGPLPATAFRGLDQSFEKTDPNVLYVKGRNPARLERCPR